MNKSDLFVDATGEGRRECRGVDDKGNRGDRCLRHMRVDHLIRRAAPDIAVRGNVHRAGARAGNRPPGQTRAAGDARHRARARDRHAIDVIAARDIDRPDALVAACGSAYGKSGRAKRNQRVGEYGARGVQHVNQHGAKLRRYDGRRLARGELRVDVVQDRSTAFLGRESWRGERPHGEDRREAACQVSHSGDLLICELSGLGVRRPAQRERQEDDLNACDPVRSARTLRRDDWRQHHGGIGTCGYAVKLRPDRAR